MLRGFSIWSFLRGVFWVLVAFGVGVGSVAAEVDWSEWRFGVVALTGFFYAVLRNAVRWYASECRYIHGDSCGWWRRFLVLVFVAGFSVFSFGCSTVRSVTEEQSVDESGASYVFSHKVSSVTGPFGKTDTAVHEMVYRGSGENGGSLAVGQHAQGQDNTGQVAAVNALGQVVVDAVLRGLAGSPSFPSGGVSSGGADGLSALLDRLERLERGFSVLQGLIDRMRSAREE